MTTVTKVKTEMQDAKNPGGANYHLTPKKPIGQRDTQTVRKESNKEKDILDIHMNAAPTVKGQRPPSAKKSGKQAKAAEDDEDSMSSESNQSDDNDG